jgi:hypothetical protein
MERVDFLAFLDCFPNENCDIGSYHRKLCIPSQNLAPPACHRLLHALRLTVLLSVHGKASQDGLLCKLRKSAEAIINDRITLYMETITCNNVVLGDK